MTVGAVEAADRAPRLRVRGKGAKTRVVPVAPEVTDAIAAYLDSRRARLGAYTSTDPLFVRLVGPGDQPEAQAFSCQSLDHLVLSWFRRAGVTPPPGPWPIPCATPMPPCSSTPAPHCPRSRPCSDTRTCPRPRCISRWRAEGWRMRPGRIRRGGHCSRRQYPEGWRQMERAGNRAYAT